MDDICANAEYLNDELKSRLQALFLIRCRIRTGLNLPVPAAGWMNIDNVRLWVVNSQTQGASIISTLKDALESYYDIPSVINGKGIQGNQLDLPVSEIEGAYLSYLKMKRYTRSGLHFYRRFHEYLKEKAKLYDSPGEGCAHCNLFVRIEFP
ncbi:hypothetical protein PHLCEN_2v11161 [Hermanssonia centrifuga]|uniref:Uncharacterized protein n=1 Tax=Hermanssonia centrifuga TaxID=98765 RepID=A0A2R6NKW8_9APHY|nr:hypothetical protein PHLCEN_2v11161 [Hermanssonia centrifuga]